MHNNEQMRPFRLCTILMANPLSHVALRNGECNIRNYSFERVRNRLIDQLGHPLVRLFDEFSGVIEYELFLLLCYQNAERKATFPGI